MGRNEEGKKEGKAAADEPDGILSSQWEYNCNITKQEYGICG